MLFCAENVLHGHSARSRGCTAGVQAEKSGENDSKVVEEAFFYNRLNGVFVSKVGKVRFKVLARSVSA